MSSSTITNDPLLSLRKRSDLIYSQQWLSGRHHWVIKDPLTMKYYHLGDEDYAILQMLDGQTTFEQIRKQYENRFAPKQLSNHYLQAILKRFHEDSLLISTSQNQAEQLLIRRDRQRWQQGLQTVTSLLAIRFRGVDPERFLQWLYPKCRWLFTLPAMLLAMFMISSALLLVMFHFSEVVDRLPQIQDFFTSRTILWLLIILAVVKVMHELGHALACKHYGGECHELGLMLLVFVPCLYCDISDSWLLASRRRRIAIAAGGMIVELVLAAICTWLWWFSVPGFFNSLCFQVMLVCSISTLLFNGNPLLRYDGYYIFSDLVGIPNLGQKSQKLLFTKLARWCLGIDIQTPQERQQTRRWLLATYATLSFAYRMFVITAIFLILYRALEPLGLSTIAYFIIGMSMATMGFSLLWGVKQMVSQPIHRQQFKRRRLITTLLVLATLLLGFFLIPLPQYVSAPAILTAQDATPIFVKVPGNLREITTIGKQVKENEQIASLDDWELKLSVVRHEETKKQKQAILLSLSDRRLLDPLVDSKCTVLESEIASLDQSLAKLQQEQNTLTIIAPHAGIILPPIWKNESDSYTTEGMLRTWTGTPFEKRNHGCYLESGRLLCHVGDPQKLEAMLIIDQNDILLVRKNQQVQIQLLQDPGNVIHGRLLEISEINLQDIHPMLAASGAIAMTSDLQGKQRPRNTSYMARVELEQQDALHLLRARGQAKIATDWQPLSSKLFRWVWRTFRFSS